MATPVSFRVSASSGVKLRGGRPGPPPYGVLLEQIAAARPGTWFKVNLNTFQSVWPDPAWLAPYSTSLDPVAHAQASPSSPSCIIRAWASFAWDDDNMRLILFGGGHANGSNGEVYMWEGRTLQWKLAFHTTSYTMLAGCGIRSVAGSLNAPASAHTYSNQVWLPRLQKFITFGGAQHNSGAPWVISDDAGNVLRTAGPFTLDMTLAGQGYVSAGTGTNMKRIGTVSENVDLPGANAWKNRDWRKDHPNTAVAAVATVGRSVVVTEENGHDVLYFHGGSGGATSKDLIRAELVDDDYRNDILSVAGGAWNNSTSDAQAAYDPVRKIFLDGSYRSTLGDAIGGWDLQSQGASNRFFSCPTSGIVGPDAAEFIANMDNTRYGNIYDERRKHFVVYSRKGALYALWPPASGPLTTGWSVRKIVGDLPLMPLKEVSDPSDPAYESGLTGKWKRSKRLDVYVHLQHPIEGNVWMFKPLDWLDPRT